MGWFLVTKVRYGNRVMQDVVYQPYTISFLIVHSVKLQPKCVSSNWYQANENLIIVSNTTYDQEYCIELQVNVFDAGTSFLTDFVSKNLQEMPWLAANALALNASKVKPMISTNNAGFVAI